MIRTTGARRWATVEAALGAYVPYAGVVVLFLAAPFEQLKPVLSLVEGPVLLLPAQRFTNLELVVIAVLGSWLAWCFARGERPWVSTTFTAPVLLLVGVMVPSALLASAHQGDALRFTARFAVGFLVYLLVANSVTTRRRLVGVLIAAGLAGSIVAGLGLLEHWQVPSVVKWLRSFNIGQFRVGGEPRIGSTLQYPTITSMYLELVFGLTLGLLLLAVTGDHAPIEAIEAIPHSTEDQRRIAGQVNRHRWWMAAPVFIALGLMAEAIILTLSRSGLVVMAGMLAVVGGMWVMQRKFDAGFWGIMALGAVISGLLGQQLLSNSTLWLRLTTENDASWYRAQYQVPSQLELQTGQVHQVDVTLTNIGRVTWQPDGEAPFRLAYHWLDPDAGEVVVFNGLRTDLPHAVRPGESVQVRARVQALSQPGRYTLAWDVMQEGRLWFSEKSPSAETLAIVRGAPVGQPAPLPMPAIEPKLVLGRRALWHLAGRMLVTRPLLGVGPDNFRLLYGRYAGLEDWDRGLHTNNMYVEFFVDTGLIGGTLFLWLVWRVLATLRETWRGMIDQAWLPPFLGIVAAVTAFLLHGFVDYFFEFTPTYLMIWMTLGLVVALKRSAQYANRI